MGGGFDYSLQGGPLYYGRNGIETKLLTGLRRNLLPVRFGCIGPDFMLCMGERKKKSFHSPKSTSDWTMIIIYQCPFSIAAFPLLRSFLLAYCIPAKSLYFSKFNHLSPQRFRLLALTVPAYFNKQVLN